MRVKHLLIGLVVLVVAVVVAGIAILKSQDFNQYKALIAEKVKEATGRDLTLAGDVDLGHFLEPGAGRQRCDLLQRILGLPAGADQNEAAVRPKSGCSHC